MPTVAGIDCSTQSTKVVVCDADDGHVLAQGKSPHADGPQTSPSRWWRSLERAAAVPDGSLLATVGAVAVGGQQHGCVLLDEAGDVVRDALLWHDNRSAADAADLVAELGGPQRWADAVGSVPVASFTVSKLRWVARNDPDAAARAHLVLLPHDWLSWQLLGGNRQPVPPWTDRGDASGTGYFSPADGVWRHDLLRAAFGRPLAVPTVLAPAAVGGQTRDGALVAAGTGDNMAAALGLGAGPGDVVVSLGTSGTAFAVHHRAICDGSGAVASFADATGNHLPLVCTLNAARVLDALAKLLGVDHEGLAQLALQAAPGAGGLTLLPYLDGERTPNLPGATGSLHGMRRDNLTPANLARAGIEGMLCGLADGLGALERQRVPVERILLIGGAARSPAVQTIAAAVFEVPVVVPEPAEYVACGAARQAAWALSASTVPPVWPVATTEIRPSPDPVAARDLRDRFTAARHALYDR